MKLAACLCAWWFFFTRFRERTFIEFFRMKCFGIFSYGAYTLPILCAHYYSATQSRACELSELNFSARSRGKCVLHNAWIKTFYVLSDCGGWRGGSVDDGRRRDSTRGGEVRSVTCVRVHHRDGRAAARRRTTRHQSSAYVLLLSTRRQLRSSSDESFVPRPIAVRRYPVPSLVSLYSSPILQPTPSPPPTNHSPIFIYFFRHLASRT